MFTHERLLIYQNEYYLDCFLWNFTYFSLACISYFNLPLITEVKCQKITWRLSVQDYQFQKEETDPQKVNPHSYQWCGQDKHWNFVIISSISEFYLMLWESPFNSFKIQCAVWKRGMCKSTGRHSKALNGK